MGQIRIEANVVGTSFQHLYLVYTDNAGNEFVIRGGPQFDIPPLFGQLVVEAGVAMEDSKDVRPIEDRDEFGSRVIDLDGRDAEDVWNQMKRAANLIDQAAIPYEIAVINLTITNTTSNSVVAAVLHAVGIDVNDTLPTIPGVTAFPGKANALLTDYSRVFSAEHTSPNDDIIWGGDLDDSIEGGDGNDVIMGFDGNDDFIGGLGSDEIDGGDGVDLANYLSMVSALSFSVGSSTTVQERSGANEWVDTISGVELFYGSEIGADFFSIANGYEAGTVLVGDFAPLFTPEASFDIISAEDYVSGVFFDGINRRFESNTDLSFVQDELFYYGIEILYGGSGDDIFVTGGYERELRGNGGNDLFQISRATPNTRIRAEDADNESNAKDTVEFTYSGSGQYLRSDANVTNGLMFAQDIEFGSVLSAWDVEEWILSDYVDYFDILVMPEEPNISVDGGGSTDFIWADFLDYGSANGATFVLTDHSVSSTAPGYVDVGGLRVEVQNFNGVVATDGDDTLVGTDGFDFLLGEDGNDTISGYNGGDLIVGGAGDDVLTSGEDINDPNRTNSDREDCSPYLYGGHGDDVYHARFKDIIVDGGLGLDNRVGYGDGSIIFEGHTLSGGQSIDDPLDEPTMTFLGSLILPAPNTTPNTVFMNDVMADEFEWFYNDVEGLFYGLVETDVLFYNDFSNQYRPEYRTSSVLAIVADQYDGAQSMFVLDFDDSADSYLGITLV